MTIEEVYKWRMSQYGQLSCDVAQTLAEKYKSMGIPIEQTEIIELRNERTGARKFLKVKKND